VDLHHCISISVDGEGFPIEAYVNINMPPRVQVDGWSWADLELDWKLRIDWTRRWAFLLLDYREFQKAVLTPQQRELAQSEISAVLQRVVGGDYPFERVPVPYFGIAIA